MPTAMELALKARGFIASQPETPPLVHVVRAAEVKSAPKQGPFTEIIVVVPGKQGALAFDVRKQDLPAGVVVKDLTGGTNSKIPNPAVVQTTAPITRHEVRIDVRSFLQSCSVSSIQVVVYKGEKHRVYINYGYENDPGKRGLNYIAGGGFEELFTSLLEMTWSSCSIREGDTYPKTMVTFNGGRKKNHPPEVTLTRTREVGPVIADDRGSPAIDI